MELSLNIRRKLAEKSETASMINLSLHQCVIGRAKSHLKIADPKVSKRHALLFVDPSGVLKLRDLCSRNGVFVNGERVKEVRVSIGDSIRMGDTTVVVVAFSAERPKAEPVNSSSGSEYLSGWP